VSEEASRDRLMEGRVGRTLEDMALGTADVALVQAAHRLAMEPRRDRLGDPHHPDFLHPGRTVLILAVDAGVRDPVALAAGALLESERADLRVPAERIAAELGPALADWVASVPLPGGDVAEALVTAPTTVRMVALAERLDHCRHAKFWPDRADQDRIHDEAMAVYGPIAERTDEALARRFAHWSEAFGRRRV
jgi:(p)ppGpp synthase/HD superfamily hydrolase